MATAPRKVIALNTRNYRCPMWEVWYCSSVILVSTDLDKLVARFPDALVSDLPPVSADADDDNSNHEFGLGCAR